MNSQIYRAFGIMLRDARAKTGLTQDDLGKRMNLSRTAITNIEKGNQGVTLLQLYEFAEKLNISPVELLPREDVDVRSRSAKQMQELVAEPSDQTLLIEMMKGRKNATRR